MGHDISKPPNEESFRGGLGINIAVSEGTWHPDKSFKLEFKDKDENYGKPPEGSLTEARAKKACRHINNELANLLSIIRGIGQRDDATQQVSVTFGKLFRYYIPISDKIVGLLLRARRWKLVDFPGEMLYQGQDDNTKIWLIANEDMIPYSRRFDFAPDNPNNQIPISDSKMQSPELITNEPNPYEEPDDIFQTPDHVTHTPTHISQTPGSSCQKSEGTCQPPSQHNQTTDNICQTPDEACQQTSDGICQTLNDSVYTDMLYLQAEPL